MFGEEEGEEGKAREAGGSFIGTRPG